MTEADTTTDVPNDAPDEQSADGATPPEDVDAGEQKPVDGEEALGDKGKQALDRMKAAKKAAEDRAKAAEAEAAELRAKAEGREAEFKAEQERRNVEAAALAKANERILRAEIRAAATGVLADPLDALRFPESVDLSAFEVGEDGSVDSDAITAAIGALVKAKPYLAAQGGPRKPAPDPAQGPRRDAQPDLTAYPSSWLPAR